MSTSCPDGTLSEEVISAIVLQKHGLIETFRTSDSSLIKTIMGRLKELFSSVDGMFREGVEQIVVHSGMAGAYVTEYIGGCSMYFYRMDPDMYKMFMQSLGQQI